MWGRVHNLFILKEHLGLNENIQIVNRGIKINTADSERPVALHVGGPFSFPSVLSDWSFLGSVFLPQFCLHSGVWQACCVCMPILGKMQTSPHWVSSKAELVLPFIFVKLAGAARLGHLGPRFLSQWGKISSFILLIRHGHNVTLLAGIIH